MGQTRSKGADFWAHHVEQYRHGDVALREYCERHGLRPSTFGHWRRRLGRETPPTTKTPSPVNVVRLDLEPVTASRSPSLEVVLANGRRVRVGDILVEAGVWKEQHGTAIEGFPCGHDPPIIVAVDPREAKGA